MFGKHRQRVKKVKDFAAKNKVFTVAAAAIVIFLLIGVISNGGKETKTEPTAPPPQEEQARPEEGETWRFYFIDLWILGIGGGFCFVKILRQRRKAKEELR
jgi:hypothetical protein